jgi:hypothetical protein
VVGVELLGDRLDRLEQLAAVVRAREQCDHALEGVPAWTERTAVKATAHACVASGAAAAHGSPGRAMASPSSRPC